LAATLPTFLIIGAQKSATRWLRRNLGQHPEVFAAEHELSFFDSRRWGLGVDWYRAQFEGWSGEPVVGESTPGYMVGRAGRTGTEEVARRIDEVLPDARLLAILRNPVDRANSALVHHVRRERIRPDLRLVDAVRSRPVDEDPLALVAAGRYAACLEPFRARAGDRLLVLLHDDVGTDPVQVYERARAHVGAPPGFVPPDLDEVVFSNRADAGERYVLTPEERVELFEWFADDVDELERRYGLDCTRWRPDRAAAVA
jgi:hypothetical protein